MTQSNSEHVSGLMAILVLSIVLVSGLLVWHPWSSTTDSLTIVIPQQQQTTTMPDDSAPAPVPDTVLT